MDERRDNRFGPEAPDDQEAQGLDLGRCGVKTRPRPRVDLRGLLGPDGHEAETAGLLFDPTEAPHRGSLPTAVRTNPSIHRFCEAVQGYGTTWREMIDEEFGGGIMSAIDFDVILERQPDRKGHGVRIDMSGKFLPYKRHRYKRHRSPRGPGVCVGPAAQPL